MTSRGFTVRPGCMAGGSSLSQVGHPAGTSGIRVLRNLRGFGARGPRETPLGLTDTLGCGPPIALNTGRRARNPDSSRSSEGPAYVLAFVAPWFLGGVGVPRKARGRAHLWRCREPSLGLAASLLPIPGVAIGNVPDPRKAWGSGTFLVEMAGHYSNPPDSLVRLLIRVGLLQEEASS